MPFLVRPSEQSCQAFMSQPNTYKFSLINGDAFFSLPFDMEFLDTMRPQELDHLYQFLSSIRGDVEEEAGPTGVRNVEYVRSVILHRFREVNSVGTPPEWAAWHAGHGFPVFDNSQRLVNFIYDGRKVAFERGYDLFERAKRILTRQHDHEDSKANSNYPEGLHQDGFTVLHWKKHGHEAVEWRKKGETVEICIYGGRFLDFSEWELFRETLTDQELEWLEDGVLAIRNIADGGWRLVCEDFSHEKHGDIHLAPPNIYSYDETCYYIPPVIDTPRKPTTPSPNTPSNGSRTPGEAENHQFVHFDQPITVSEATFNNLEDWMQFKSTLTKIDLDLLRQGVLSLEGSSNTGIKKTLGWYTGSPVEQALAYTILRDQYRVGMDALSSNTAGIEARFQALRHEQSSKQQSPSRQASYCSPSCPAYRDLVQSMHATKKSRTVSGSSAEETDVEGSQFTDISGPGAFRDPTEISPAPRVVLVRPTLQVTPVHPAPLVIHNQRAHHGSGPEPRSIYLQQPSAHTSGQRRTVHLQHSPPFLATQPPPASPPGLIVRKSKHQVTKSAQGTLSRDDLKTLLNIAENELTKAHRAQNVNHEQVDEQVVYLNSFSRQPAPASNVSRRESLVPEDTDRSRASIQVPMRLSSPQLRSSRCPRVVQRGSGAVTNRSATESKSSRYQAYAEDSPEDSPRPSPGSWREV